MNDNPYALRTKCISELGFKNYVEYQKSPLWKSIRKRVFKKRKKVCHGCLRTARQVHHSIYSKAILSGKSIKGLIPICGRCHRHIEWDGERKTSLHEANERLENLRSESLKSPPREDDGEMMSFDAAWEKAASLDLVFLPAPEADWQRLVTALYVLHVEYGGRDFPIPCGRMAELVEIPKWLSSRVRNSFVRRGIIQLANPDYSFARRICQTFVFTASVFQRDDSSR